MSKTNITDIADEIPFPPGVLPATKANITKLILGARIARAKRCKRLRRQIVASIITGILLAGASIACFVVGANMWGALVMPVLLLPAFHAMVKSDELKSIERRK